MDKIGLNRAQGQDVDYNRDLRLESWQRKNTAEQKLTKIETHNSRPAMVHILMICYTICIPKYWFQDFL